MKILVACEKSQAVCKALRARGHEAYSCDVAPCTGGHPEWHLQQDVTPLLCEAWDMVLAFPPCTHLASSGARWFAEKRADGRQAAGAAFFMQLVNAPCSRVAVENPVGIMSSIYRKPDQIVQPWQFGEPYTKSTCLWLKGLPPLKPTNALAKPEGGWRNQSFTSSGRYGGFKNLNSNGAWLRWDSEEIKDLRSLTFNGIAEAMGDQWGGL